MSKQAVLLLVVTVGKPRCARKALRRQLEVSGVAVLYVSHVHMDNEKEEKVIEYLA